MLEDLHKEEPDSKCNAMERGKGMLMVGCLFSLAVYKLALGRVGGRDVSGEVGEMICRLEKGDLMRAGEYKEWREFLERK